jgi:hypothetical protein
MRHPPTWSSSPLDPWDEAALLSRQARKYAITESLANQGSRNGFANRVALAAGGEKTMIHVSRRSLVSAFLLSLVACFVSVGMLAASRRISTGEEQLDRLIPREKWAGAGLNKLTAPEQQTLADEITTLVGAARTAQGGAAVELDRTQWRKLHRLMSKDEVRKLLGDPLRISAGRFGESWDYIGSGMASFDAKGRLDYWLEP